MVATTFVITLYSVVHRVQFGAVWDGAHSGGLESENDTKAANDPKQCLTHFYEVQANK